MNISTCTIRKLALMHTHSQICMHTYTCTSVSTHGLSYAHVHTLACTHCLHICKCTLTCVHTLTHPVMFRVTYTFTMRTHTCTQLQKHSLIYIDLPGLSRVISRPGMLSGFVGTSGPAEMFLPRPWLSILCRNLSNLTAQARGR